MFYDLWDFFRVAIGMDQVDIVIPTGQMVVRTIVVFLVALVLIRIGKRRFLGGYTAFDILLGFLLGSIMSRTITGAITFVNMVFIVITLVGLHWVIALLTYYFDRASGLIKNSERQLIEDGEIQEKAMMKSKIGQNDLLEALRQKANVESPDKVKAAYLERDGSITVILKEKEPRIVEVAVENGVQTVKIVIE